MKNKLIAIEDYLETNDAGALTKCFEKWRDVLDSKSERQVNEIDEGIAGVRVYLQKGFGRFMSAWISGCLSDANLLGQGGIAVAGSDGNFHRLSQFTQVDIKNTLYLIASGDNRDEILDKVVLAVDSYDELKFDSDGFKL